ncbi:hypothetical protein CF386_08965 [Paraphotobacterium marinum]|uniref:HTH LytTR-type domain-containing protein n=1 Tax=Paraphotobacterium marinum TaxID=1755811 RepID=A0A220VFW9_9GAMM|nr:LytTR family DNA-binding domain-containing protein [Paraphotobacterium marinum]ASK79191.1 hypothetical protein CF386_08965 [Paraphotobacterium marinum]
MKLKTQYSTLEKAYFVFLIFYLFWSMLKKLISSIYLFNNEIKFGGLPNVKPETINSILCNELFTDLMRVFIVLLFLMVIKRVQSKYNFKYYSLILFTFAIVFFCLLISAFALMNSQVLNFYIFHPELRVDKNLNILSFWFYFLSFFYDRIYLWIAIDSNICPVLVAYIFIVEASKNKKIIMLTNDMIYNIYQLSGIKSMRKASECHETKCKNKTALKEEQKHNEQENDPSLLLVKKLGVTNYIAIDDISVIQAAGNYLDIEANEQSYTIRSSISELLDSLQAYFIRIHRSTVINTKEILEVKVEKKSRNLKMEVKLKSGKWYTVSKTYQKRIELHLKNIAEQH